jgi:xanthine/CO dehydrogenase XdhC/CoxF family maturation factor
MSSDAVFFRELADDLERRGRLALASVVETKGSGPSRIGRRFVIFEDGTFRGTIGGGPFEALVVADSASLFREDGPVRILKWYDFFEREIESGQLREPTNMICGGSSRVSIELLKAAPSLVVLGGGHVGRALALLGRELGYDVTVADDREAYTQPERFPPGVRTVRTTRNYEIPTDALPPGRDRYVAVVTRCWETDLAALRPWLAPAAPPARRRGGRLGGNGAGLGLHGAPESAGAYCGRRWQAASVGVVRHVSSSLRLNAQPATAVPRRRKGRLIARKVVVA